MNLFRQLSFYKIINYEFIDYNLMINNLCKIAAYIGVGYDICKQDDEVPDKIKQEFAKHVTEFGLNYPTKEEYDYRLSIFA